MNADEARGILIHAVMDETGAHMQIRLGRDPGHEAMLELRRALRILFWHWKAQDALPYDIVAAASLILWWRPEAEDMVSRLSSQPSEARNELAREVSDVFYLTFDLLSGPEAAPITKRRDLGE